MKPGTGLPKSRPRSLASARRFYSRSQAPSDEKLLTFSSAEARKDHHILLRQLAIETVGHDCNAMRRTRCNGLELTGRARRIADRYVARIAARCRASNYTVALAKHR
jgi:hypothetical protein